MVKLESGQNAPGVPPWPAVAEQLLDGVTHQLSNRFALLSGISQILGTDDSVPPILRALADEVPKLEETLRLLRLLGSTNEDREEATETGSLLRDAAALAALHPALRDVAIEVDDVTAIPPVVIRPLTVLRAIVGAIVAEGERPNAPASVRVAVVNGDDVVTVQAGDQAPIILPSLLAARRNQSGN